MASTYFDPTADADKLLLPPVLRTAAELANVAALAEADVVGHYTANPGYFVYTAYDAFIRSMTPGQPWLLGFTDRGTGEDVTATTTGAAQIRVYLAGYKADAAHADVDPNLKRAMRLTIARVIKWWMAGWSKQSGVGSSSDVQAKTRSYNANSEDAFPSNWDALMTPFDVRPLPWGL